MRDCKIRKEGNRFGGNEPRFILDGSDGGDKLLEFLLYGTGWLYEEKSASLILDI
jgi:hypothetical protein